MDDPSSMDEIKIYDIDNDGNSIMIASLTGTDDGPISSEIHYLDSSHWYRKIISSTNNKMLVEFRSDGFRSAYTHIDELFGFSASLIYSPLPSNQCEKGMEMTKKTIQSPNYPDLYNNNLVCKWLISVPDRSHITLKFLLFDVRFSVIEM